MTHSAPGDRAQAKSAETYDAVVIGAGFAGLYAVFRLRQLGLKVLAFAGYAGFRFSAPAN